MYIYIRCSLYQKLQYKKKMFISALFYKMMDHDSEALVKEEMYHIERFKSTLYSRSYILFRLFKGIIYTTDTKVKCVHVCLYQIIIMKTKVSFFVLKTVLTLLKQRNNLWNGQPL